jgi:hypothetical protein
MAKRRKKKGSGRAGKMISPRQLASVRRKLTSASRKQRVLKAKLNAKIREHQRKLKLARAMGLHRAMEVYGREAMKKEEAKKKAINVAIAKFEKKYAKKMARKLRRGGIKRRVKARRAIRAGRRRARRVIRSMK